MGLPLQIAQGLEGVCEPERGRLVKAGISHDLSEAERRRVVRKRFQNLEAAFHGFHKVTGIQWLRMTRVS
jgi:hypothetical protein